jgi:short subunit dehydrogenase-like uncharacterized protein
LLPRLEQLGIDFVVAGRDAAKTETLGAELGVPSRVFSLDDPAEVDQGLEGIDVLLNAAGPFMYTAGAMLDGCLRKSVHYLDLSGEVDSLSRAAEADEVARGLGLMVLPAIGFDVVPSDCVAVHVARRLPGATRLTIHVSASNLMSHGSGVTLAEHIGIPVHTRRDGRLEQMRLRMQMRWADFGARRSPTVAVSWGDVVTAYHSTGIPNIEVYFEATSFRLAAVTINQYWGWLLRTPTANAWFRSYADMLPAGPTKEERAQQRSTILVEAESSTGVMRSRIETPEAYEFTAATATRVIHDVMDGRRRPGFQTPGTLFGPDFVLDFEGVTREDL